MLGLRSKMSSYLLFSPCFAWIFTVFLQKISKYCIYFASFFWKEGWDCNNACNNTQCWTIWFFNKSLLLPLHINNLKDFPFASIFSKKKRKNLLLPFVFFYSSFFMTWNYDEDKDDDNGERTEEYTHLQHFQRICLSSVLGSSKKSSLYTSLC